MQNRKLRLVFMGTPEFAVDPLKALVENGYNVVGVVTAPDKPAGRGRQIEQSPVKKYAVENNLAVFQPEKLKNQEFIDQLKKLKADLQIVVAFRMLPEAVWNMPPKGTINLHASLLPQYRGAAPINWAIINGEKETGVTTFFLQQEIDTGKIIFCETVTIDDHDNAEILHDKLMQKGVTLVLKTVDAIDSGNYPLMDQKSLVNEEKPLKTAPKIFKEDCKINWTKTADDIYNFIRGLSPYPAAWTDFISDNGIVVSVKIFEAEKIVEIHSFHPGMILTDGKKYLKIAVNSGFIKILSLQQASKKRLSIEEFLRGFKISEYKIYM
ncbi:MAG: methionyl-tRNA formyltransferase [Bacteroidia bacterium]|nr:methionyl-tRNA formyltransferase [Bacteroidia bacterium]